MTTARCLSRCALSMLLVWPLAACEMDADPATGNGGEPSLAAHEQVAGEATREALASITADDLLGRIEVLSSDAFEGRAPATAGEDSTIAYLTREFAAMRGMRPGNPDGSWLQAVPLVGITSRGSAMISVGGSEVALSFPDNYVGVSRLGQPRVELTESEVVFVGYGVVAPEYDWNDFKDVDLHGKTLVMLVNDPPVPDPADPERLDESLFRGEAMTYYGRWTYKYEIASEWGAAAAIIVHETGPAGYPWEVVSGSFGAENFDLQGVDAGGRVMVEAWITREKAEELFSAAGLDFEELKSAAARRDFSPVELGATAHFDIRNELREVASNNVIAMIEGSDPERGSEYVVYTAHWDHLGRDTTLAGDQIFNGAYDNASGTAALLEIAEAYSLMPTPPARSILFLAVTAEERGLLGARHYATNPLYPLERTLAVINMDGMNQWGRTRDIVVIGHGNSTLDDVLERAAAAQGRHLAPDPEPEKGFFYRSDHFEFAKVGVPALYTDKGTDYIGRPAGFGEEVRRQYTENDYHKPSDEIKPDWNLSGAVEDARLFFLVGLDVAQGDVWPEWRPGTEFRGRREGMLRDARAAR